MAELGWRHRQPGVSACPAPQHYTVISQKAIRSPELLLKGTHSSWLSLLSHTCSSSFPCQCQEDITLLRQACLWWLRKVKLSFTFWLLVSQELATVEFWRTELFSALHLFILYKPQWRHPLPYPQRLESHSSLSNCPSRPSPLLPSLWSLSWCHQIT